jgi:hypothetical protein
MELPAEAMDIEFNTWEQSEAKVYKTEASAQKAISRLIEFGEGDNNTFELVSA